MKGKNDQRNFNTVIICGVNYIVKLLLCVFFYCFRYANQLSLLRTKNVPADYGNVFVLITLNNDSFDRVFDVIKRVFLIRRRI